MFMVLLIFSLGNFKIGAMKLFFWILVPLRREGVHAWVGMVCYHCIVDVLIINSSKKLYFL